VTARLSLFSLSEADHRASQSFVFSMACSYSSMAVIFFFFRIKIRAKVPKSRIGDLSIWRRFSGGKKFAFVVLYRNFHVVSML
jgi:hypothetical protein